VAAIGGVVVLMRSHVPREAFLLRGSSAERTRRRLAKLLPWSVRSTMSSGMYVIGRARALASSAAAFAQRPPWTRLTQSVARTVLLPTLDELHGWPYAGAEELGLGANRADSGVGEDRRRARDLNARGSHLRRAGSPTAAASLHLEALEIFRSLNDQSAQALTLNSLALALAASGETEAAVERFEQSLLILRERPEDRGQAEVIANLGFTLLRQGGDRRARELLSEALEKLPPDSRAAHKVEAQLRRAS
jgi:tetratricopeptide (TPR) repeat protein